MMKKLLKLSQMKNAHYQEKQLLNEKILLTTFQMKTFFVLLITSLSSFSVTAQIDQSDKTTITSLVNQNFEKKTGIVLYLQNTEQPIYASQKHLRAKNLNQENIDLSNAIALQEYAMKLFESGKKEEALICSSKARQIGVGLLTNFRGTDYASHYDNFEGEEAQLAEIKKDTSTTEQWLAKAKQ